MPTNPFSPEPDIVEPGKQPPLPDLINPNPSRPWRDADPEPLDPKNDDVTP
jgi:hypothetical protein